MEKKIFRLGIIGTGRIAHRFVPEARVLQEIQIEIVYNPNLSSAKKFAEEFQIQHYTDNLNEFLQHIDMAYIASPHETHVQYSSLMLQNGKHVLCEKPLCFIKEEAEELFRLAEKQNCILMEGIKTAYCPGFIKLVEVVQSGVIGKVCNVEACFTKLEKSDTRELTDVIYGGSFTELGSYVLLSIIKLLGDDWKDIRFASIYQENGLDILTKIYFKYDNGLAQGTCGLGVKSEGQMIVSGTRGYVIAQAPWWKTQKFQVRYENPDEVVNYEEEFIGDGLRYELMTFLNVIRQEKSAVYEQMKEISLAIAKAQEIFLHLRFVKRNSGDNKQNG